MAIPLFSFLFLVPVVWLICALAVAAGVGGGALYMPFYVWVTGDAHIAVPLAKITTNGVAWSAFFYNMAARHPEEKQPLINYDVALILEPLTLVGTIVGVLLNLVMTNAQILVTLIMVTSLTAVKTCQNGWAKKKKEDAMLNEPLMTPEGEMTEIPGLGHQYLDTPISIRSLETDTTRADEMDAVPLYQKSKHESTTALKELDAYYSRQYPVEKILLLLVCMIWHGGSLFVVGGPWESICGASWKKVVLVGNVIMQVVVTMVWRQKCIARQTEKDRLGAGSGFRFDPVTTLIFPFLSMCAGVCAGALGIAGGLIKGPIMIQWGLVPQASTATAIFMIMFTSSSTILQFILLGRIDFKPAAIFWVTGFAGGILGSHVLKILLQRYGRQSYVSLFLAFIIIVSGICMAGVVIAEMVGLVESESTSVSLQNFCSEL